MNRALFCSTGTMIGRANGYDIRLVTKLFPKLMEAGVIDGGELMMLPVYYDRLQAVAREWMTAGIVFPVLHCEKEVGTLLSNAAEAAFVGDSSAVAQRKSAIEYFRLNCEMCQIISAPRMVLHLWGGMLSDRHIAYNVEALTELTEIADAYHVHLLIENVPSNTHDPLSNWKRLLPLPDTCGLIFDTRFGQLHRQIRETWSDGDVQKRIEHIHISDILCEPREFSKLRPILHPGEGMIDFPGFASILSSCGYDGTFTLESPVIQEGGADTEKLTHTLRQLRALFISSPESSDL